MITGRRFVLKHKKKKLNTRKDKIEKRKLTEREKGKQL